MKFILISNISEVKYRLSAPATAGNLFPSMMTAVFQSPSISAATETLVLRAIKLGLSSVPMSRQQSIKRYI